MGIKFFAAVDGGVADGMGSGAVYGIEIVRVRAYWDAQDSTNAGWYAAAFLADRSEAMDSMKIWWPVDLDEFGEDDDEGVCSALTEAFPGAEIEMK